MAVLQRTGLGDSTYDQPQQNWICNRAEPGTPCPRGPDASGRCVTNFECTPLKRGGRWLCTRDTVYGGRCQDGPHPDGTCCLAVIRCQPRLSWRGRRGRLSRWAVSLALGAIVLNLASGGVEMASPGPLSSSHSTAVDGCGACHASAHNTFSGWLVSALENKPDDQSLRCGLCHDRGMDPLAPHSVSDEQLLAWTDRAKATANTSVVPVRLEVAQLFIERSWLRSRELACAVCHDEHQGAQFDPKQLSRDQCQGCHLNRFSRFETDHPEFVNFPYARRTRIFFDHESHQSKHHPKEEQSFECGGCHVPDPRQRQMLAKPYQQVCADCHAHQLVREPVPVLVVPLLDIESLEERGYAIGEWPDDGAEEVSPFIRLLLSADPELREALSIVDEVEYLDDLSDEEEVDETAIEAVVAVAWGIKKLFYALARSGPEALAWYLHQSTQSSIPEHVLTDLWGGLPRAALRNRNDAWFPNLEDELAQHFALAPGSSRATARVRPALAGDIGACAIAMLEPAVLRTRPNGCDTPVSMVAVSSEAYQYWPVLPLDEAPAPPDEADEEEAWASASGWSDSEDEFGLVFQPRGHADPFLRAWLELAARLRDEVPGPFNALIDKHAPGKCGKCHSVDVEPRSGDASVRWYSFQVNQKTSVTQFSHKSHFSLGDQKGCETCHTATPKADYASSYDDTNPLEFISNYQSMTIATCRPCHNAQQARSDCLTCHRYHVGEFNPTLLTVKSR